MLYLCPFHCDTERVRKTRHNTGSVVIYMLFNRTFYTEHLLIKPKTGKIHHYCQIISSTINYNIEPVWLTFRPTIHIELHGCIPISYHVFCYFQNGKEIISEHVRQLSAANVLQPDVRHQNEAAGLLSSKRGGAPSVARTRHACCMRAPSLSGRRTCTKVGHGMLHRLGHYFTIQPSRKHTYLHQAFV